MQLVKLSSYNLRGWTHVEVNKFKHNKKSTLKKVITQQDLLMDVGVRVVDYPARAERIQLIEQLNRILKPTFNIKQFKFIF